MSGKSAALALYARIFRAHRTRLPHHLRELGDAYVREEFKRHKKADAKFLTAFFKEWNGYVEMLEQQSPAMGTLGRDLDPAAVANMTAEQKEQLARLKTEARNPYRDG